MSFMPDSSQSISTNSHASNTFFLIAFGLINTLAFTLLVCGIGFLVGLTISAWQFPLGCLLALIGNYFAADYFFGEKSKYLMLKSSGAILGLIISLILLSSLFYDISFDGQWYHQETIFRLHDKWNPVYQKLAVPLSENVATDKEVWCSGIDNPVSNPTITLKPSVNLKFLNINHFPKGIEIIEASVYQLSNRIETGKAVNGIFLSASLFLALSFLYKINLISTPKKWLLAILLSFNPIALTQLLSFCVDGVMACSLLCLIIMSCLLFRETNKYFLWLFGSLIVLTSNIKFTSLVFTGIFCAGLLLALLIYKGKNQFKRVLFIGVFSGITGIFCCGFHPFVTNFTNEGNVFYGLKETQDELLVLTPPIFRNLNRFEKLFLSLASHTDSYSTNNNSISDILKIPFTVNRKELANANDPEVKLSAFGPFFSGALLIAILIFFIALIRFRKSTVFKQALAVLIIIAATIIIMPGSWWGRYVPQFWLLPVSILFMSEFFSFKTDRFLRSGLYLILGLNIAWASLAIIFNLFISSRIDYQMSQLKALRQPITVEYCPYRSFKSNRVRFYESHIPILERQLTGNYIYNIIHSNTRFETPVPLPSVNKPVLLRWSEKLKME